MSIDNFDNLIEKELKFALKPGSPSDSFNKALMKRIALQKEFELENIKEDKMAKNIFKTILGAFISLVGVIIYFVLRSPGNANIDTPIIERSSNFLESFSMKFLSIVGLESPASIVLAVITVGAIIVLYNGMDKLIFKKR